MRQALHARFLDKAQAAMVGAIEIYNKPTFHYREETFCLLALNAWELAIKAQILKIKKNNLRSIRLYEPRKRPSGKPTKKLFLVTNRSGNPMTLSLSKCVLVLDMTTSRLPNEVKANLDALTAIRDNAAHYVVASPVLAKQVLEIACAAVKNFVLLTKAWFGKDLSSTMSLMLPLAYLDGNKRVDAVVTSKDEGRLVNHLQELAQSAVSRDSPFSVAVRLDVKLERSSLQNASKFRMSRDSDAIKLTVSEESIRSTYPWDYAELTKRLAKRYKDFKSNNVFHAVRKPLMSDDRLVKPRFLDPGNPRSQRKDFYSPNILPLFDLHYTKR